jgi:hypothetical protein
MTFGVAYIDHTWKYQRIRKGGFGKEWIEDIIQDTKNKILKNKNVVSAWYVGFEITDEMRKQSSEWER